MENLRSSLVRVVAIPNSLGKPGDPPETDGIDVYFDVTEQVSSESIAVVLQALNDLQILEGGLGFRFEVPDALDSSK